MTATMMRRRPSPPGDAAEAVLPKIIMSSSTPFPIDALPFYCALLAKPGLHLPMLLRGGFLCGWGILRTGAGLAKHPDNLHVLSELA